VTDQEQKDRFANEDEPKDEPDVEGHRHASRLDERADLAETEEPDVEAHRFDKVEQKHEL
jgi:hypothetical protein